MRKFKALNYALILALILSVFACSSSGTDDEPAFVEQTAPDDDFLVGADVTRLVPAGNPLWYKGVYLAGFGMLGIRDFSKILSLNGGASGEALGVNDPPYARSMVITRGTDTFAISVIDACVMGNRVIGEITKKASERTSIPQRNIFVAATHSHSSLDLLGAYGGVPEDYREFLIDAAVRSIANACEAKTPARLMVSQAQYRPSTVKKEDGDIGSVVLDGKGNPVTWTYNRRGWPGMDNMYSSPDIDYSITVLQALDYATGKPVGELINFGCHPVLVTLETRKFSRDFVGYLEDYVQKTTGAPAIFIQGTLGDVNPGDWEMIGVTGENCYAYAKQFGEDLARQAVASMSNQTRVSNDMHIDQGDITDIPVDNPLMLLLLGIVNKNLEMDYDGSILDGVKAETKVRYVRLGRELQIAMLPGEAVTHMALGVRKNEHTGQDGNPIPEFEGIKEAMTAPYRMVTSVTGDTLIYLVPSQEWKNMPSTIEGEGGYEETMSMSLNGKLADACREKAIELIDRDK